MDAPSAYHQPASVQIIRDRRGLVLGRLEVQSSTGKIVARDARGLLSGTYRPDTNTTRDARGLRVGTGNLLPALLVR